MIRSHGPPLRLIRFYVPPSARIMLFFSLFLFAQRSDRKSSCLVTQSKLIYVSKGLGERGFPTRHKRVPEKQLFTPTWILSNFQRSSPFVWAFCSLLFLFSFSLPFSSATLLFSFPLVLFCLFFFLSRHRVISLNTTRYDKVVMRCHGDLF